MDGGEVMREYLADLRAFAASKADDVRMTQYLDPLRAAIDVLEDSFEWLLEAGRTDPAVAGAAAVDFLKLMGLTGSAHMWAKMAAASIDRIDGDNTGFYQRKLALASYFMGRLLPQTSSLAAAVKSGPELLMALEAEAF
jgi:hypothetical protein